ncbi:hypothetical protein K402DRAFT_447573 [Aulographum hederae CBS 113979]|uniref:Autophagy protein 5 n=1 Tax=Aulographum hederae CBS 113979 TaxID=1176131 RepID=A0A6G1GUB9_9PEZI|nr:hypothetical protein K402DRAFT_447573 [Aulographum hederae CBS 113979]
MSSPDLLQLQQKIWQGTVPLEIRLSASECRTYDQSDPYLIQIPRLTYVPLLLTRLHAFFTSSLIDPSVPASAGWLSYEDVPLKWHYPIGLLWDLYSGREAAYYSGGRLPKKPKAKRSAIPGDAAGEEEVEKSGGDSEESDPGSSENKVEDGPWKLVLHFTEWPAEYLARLEPLETVLEDAFKNGVKEASFIRHGSGKVVMGLGYEDSKQLWEAVKEHDLSRYNKINTKLLSPRGIPLRHIPLKVYLPTNIPSPSTTADPIPEEPSMASPGHLKVVQSLIPPTLSPSSRHPQTLGTAMHELLPTLFPSRRSPILALPVLHGAVVPLAAVLEELARVGAYADGFLHIVVVMMG